MKCKSGINKYKIPEFSQIQTVLLAGNQKHNTYAFRIQQISIEEFEKRLVVENDHPKLFAINDNKIYFWPCPNKPYEIKIKYFPPLKES